MRALSQSAVSGALEVCAAGRPHRLLLDRGLVMGVEGLPGRCAPPLARALAVVWLSEALTDPEARVELHPGVRSPLGPPVGALDQLLQLALERLLRLRELGPWTLESPPEAPDFGEGPAPAPLPPELDELRAVAARCLELNPLAAADLSPTALHEILSGEALLGALVRGAARYRPERYARAGAGARATAAALQELLDGAREAVRDPDTLSTWLRELRRAFPPPAEPGAGARATARGLSQRARLLARSRRWPEALDAARAAIAMDPRAPGPRAIGVCCQLALGLLSPTDARLNLSALVFPDPTSAARTLRLARSLLRPEGFAEVAAQVLAEFAEANPELA